ncbi:hypothetical protein BH23VER1_BH23VER1_28590 [soil metagenome]
MNPKELGDKSNYSYDEIIEQLRQSRSSKSGGRRRKRRTKQPKKKWSLSTKVTLSVFVVVAVSLIVGIIVFAVMHLRYQSDGFRRQVSARVSELSGYEVEFSKLRVSGRTLSAGEARAEGPESGMIRHLSSGRVSGRLGVPSFFGDPWTLDPLHLNELTVILGMPPAPDAAGGGVSVPTPATLEGASGWGLSAHPEDITLGMVQIRETNISWGEPTAAGGMSQIRGLGLYGDIFGAKSTFRGIDGELEWGGTTWNINQVTADAVGSDVKIKRAQLSAGIRDELNLAGTIALRPGGGAYIQGTIRDLDSALVAPRYWQTRLVGGFDAALEFEMDFVEGALPQLTAGFEFKSLGVTNLEIFDALAVYVAAPEFNYVEFKNVTGEFRRVGEQVTISGIDAHRPGLVRVKGEIRVGPEGALGGDLSIGLPEAAFHQVGGVPDLFEVQADGFAWAAMSLSGTLDEPLDDLSVKVKEETRHRIRDRMGLGILDPTQPIMPDADGIGSGGIFDGDGSLVPATPPDSPPPPPPPTQEPPAQEPAQEPAGSREEALERAFEELIR